MRAATHLFVFAKCARYQIQLNVARPVLVTTKLPKSQSLIPRGRVEVTNLGLSEHQTGGHLEAFGSREVLVLPELVFQLQKLLTGEGSPRSARLAEQRVLGSSWGRSERRGRVSAGAAVGGGSAQGRR